jgi:hypothetical protein
VLSLSSHPLWGPTAFSRQKNDKGALKNQTEFGEYNLALSPKKMKKNRVSEQFEILLSYFPFYVNKCVSKVRREKQKHYE